MKKLLIVLMVIAMASFLFTGCIPSVPVVEEPVVEEPVVVVPATDAPIITSIAAGVVLYNLAATTNYINAADIVAGVTVTGVGPVNSIIKIYVGGVWAATGATGNVGVFTSSALTAAGLGTTDGSKVVTAIATQVGLAESAASTAYTFTQDTVAPTITSVVGSSVLDYITVTFSEAVDGTTVSAATWRYSAPALVVPTSAVITVVVASSTVARLSELVADPLLLADITLSVSYAAPLVTDLAGNPLAAVTVYGLTI